MKELEQLRSWVAQGSTRLISITAAAGFGKSTLASKLYEELAPEFEGKLWVYFRQAYSFVAWARSVMKLWGQELDERIPEDQIITQVVNGLSQKRVFLVLDNLEIVLENPERGQSYAKFFRRFLGSSSESVALLTSRINSDLVNSIFAKSLTISGLAQVEAIALLQAMAVQGIEENQKQFVELADGNPLLLRLTAEWLKAKRGTKAHVSYVLNQEDLNLFSEIVGDHKGEPEVTIGRVLEESVSQLEHRLKKLWQDLSVYRTSIVLAQAQVMQPEATEEDLRELARRSLLEEQPTEEGWEFSFLSLIQRFAWQRASDQTKAHQRAISYYRSITKPEPWQTKEDISSYVEIFHHYCDLKQYNQAFETIQFCNSFLSLKGYGNIQIALYEPLVSNEELVQKWDNPEDIWRLLNSFITLGNAFCSIGMYQQAISPYQQGLILSQKYRNFHGVASSLGGLGNVYSFLGHHHQAIQYLEQWLDISRQRGSQLDIGNALGSLANAYISKGQYQQALKHYQQWLEITVEVDDQLGKVKALGGIANTHTHLGNNREAIVWFAQALALSSQTGCIQVDSQLLIGLGNAYNNVGEYQEALRVYQLSLVISQQMNDLSGVATSLGNLGTTYYYLSKFQEAVESYQESLHISRQLGKCSGEITALIGLGLILFRLGQYSKALEIHQQSLELSKQIGDPQKEAIAWFNFGLTLAKIERISKAINAFKNARQLFQAMGLESQVQNCDYEIQQLEQSDGVE